MDILKCYVIPFTGSKLKRHALDKHLLPLRTPPWPLSIDMTVDHSKIVRQSHRGNVLWRLLHVYVCFLCVCNNPQWDTKLWCAFDLHHTTKCSQLILLISFAISTKIRIFCSIWHKRNCFDLFYVELQWTKKMHFLFYSLFRAVTFSFC